MGVKNFWPLLEPTGQPAKLSDLKGYRVAIDLSNWIVEMSQITNSQGEKMSGLKPHIRTLFWRCYNLLRNQVRPVFVIDGVSPSVKGKTIEVRKTGMVARSPSPERRNRGDHGPIVECKELLDCLGLPCIVSSGKAEALCAKLDRDGLVDGCITDDSDVFLYGANTVYKHFTCNKQKTGEMKVYHAAFIEDKLGLDREKLVAIALLLGSDYTDGAKNISPEMAMKLLGKDGDISDTKVLDRMKLWREDPGAEFAELEKIQALPKPTHCSKCNHQGTVILHKAKGCMKCGTKKTCNENHGHCDCEYHDKQQQVADRALELRVRRSAIEDPNFPPEEVIKEYMEPDCDPVNAFRKVEWSRPNFGKLQKYLEETLKFPKSEARQKTNEVLISWGLTHSKAKQQKYPLRCIRIVKARVQNAVPVLEVLWEDQGLGDQDLITIEDRETMVKYLPRAVERFDEENDKRGQSKKKMNRFNKVCKRITDLFKSKKRLTFTPEEEHPSTSDTSMDASSSNVRPVSFTSTVGPSTSTCALSQSPGSPPLIDADSLVDAPSADFSEFLCAKLPDSSPEKSPEKVRSTEAEKFAVLKRRGKKRKSYSLDKARSAKKLKLNAVPSSGIQPGIADMFKLNSDSASASIPVSSPAVATRSKSCSSDFTDGASTCSDLISDDDNETDAPFTSAPNTSNVIDLTTETVSSSRPVPQTVVPTLRRSPRESVRQKALQRPSVTPSKGSRKRLRFSDGDKQPKINDFMRNTKSSRLSGIRL